MDEHSDLRDTVVERLPAAIRAMDGTSRKMFILMRMRKTEAQIAGRLGLCHEAVREVGGRIRHALAQEGLLDMVEDPEFVTIHAEGPDDIEIPLPSGGLGPEEKLLVSEFLSALRVALGSLPDQERTLLRLMYRNGLSAREIAEFSQKTGVVVIPGNVALSVPDVYSACGRAVTKVAAQLRRKYEGDLSMGPKEVKALFEDEDIAREI